MKHNNLTEQGIQLAEPPRWFTLVFDALKRRFGGERVESPAPQPDSIYMEALVTPPRWFALTLDAIGQDAKSEQA